MPESGLRNLAELKAATSHRVSSYDTTGGNHDYWSFDPEQTRTIAEINGLGCIRHIWMTISSGEPFYLRKLVLRMYWDGVDQPSVEVPVGDFFGMGHGIAHSFVSAPLQMWDRAFNCWFPMPFESGARITIENQGEQAAIVYFYVDYERDPGAAKENGRFHAIWRRQIVTHAQMPTSIDSQGRTVRLNGEDTHNYVVLEAEGRGHYVGCHLNLDTNETGWWGEGDDMFVIDGEPWPPRLHGTGTEDYFCGAWNYNLLDKTFCTPYYGYHFKGNSDYTGKHSQYRYHIVDPIRFEKSLRFTIEHGHANDRSGDWTSVAYWYQSLPAKPLPELLPVEERIPFRYGGIEKMRQGKQRIDLPVHNA